MTENTFLDKEELIKEIFEKMDILDNNDTWLRNSTISENHSAYKYWASSSDAWEPHRTLRSYLLRKEEDIDKDYLISLIEKATTRRVGYDKYFLGKSRIDKFIIRNNPFMYQKEESLLDLLNKFNRNLNEEIEFLNILHDIRISIDHPCMFDETRWINTKNGEGKYTYEHIAQDTTPFPRKGYITKGDKIITIKLPSANSFKERDSFYVFFGDCPWVLTINDDDDNIFLFGNFNGKFMGDYMVGTKRYLQSTQNGDGIHVGAMEKNKWRIETITETKGIKAMDEMKDTQYD